MNKIKWRELQSPPFLIQDEDILRHEPVMLKRNGQPLAVIIPMVEYEAFRTWQEAMNEPWPSEPPPTPEGDKEALAAVERIGTMFPPLDAATAQYIAESHDFSLDYNFLLDDND